MSQENVEIVRAGYKAWNAGDMEALGELTHPDIVLRLPEVGQSQGLSWAK